MPTEEQTQNSVGLCNLRSGSYTRAGQRLTISDRLVTKLAFYIKRTGTATGPVTFTIRRVSDDGIVNSKGWGDAGDLPTDFAWQEATFDTPLTVNEEVRISAEFSGGSSGNEVQVAGATSDVKGGEHFEWYKSGWAKPAEWDFAYIYTYGEVAETTYNTKVGSPTHWGWKKCGYGGAEKCPVGAEPSWAWQAPTSEGPSKTPQGGPPSFIWGSE